MANIKEIKNKVEGQRWEDALDKAFEKANEKVEISGFRKGKAPKDVFLKKYGKESLFMEAADVVISEEYRNVLEENKDLEIVAEPKVELLSIDESGVEFMIKLILKPEVELGEYKNLGVTKEEAEVTQDEIDAELDALTKKYEEESIKPGEAVLGDTVNIDFEGFKDGVAFEGGKADGHMLKLGSGSFIPGFEEQLVGSKAGDTVDVKVTFPEEYPSEDLKGQEVLFKVKVNEVKETIKRELDAEFFEDLAMEGINDKESLEKQLKENIRVRKDVDSDNKYIDELLEKASENVKVEIPEEMIDDEVHRMLHQYEDQLKMQGLTLEQYYQFTNTDEAKLKEQMKEEANKRVKYRLMLEAIIKAENISVTEEEANKEAEAIAAKYQMDKEEFLKAFGGLNIVKYDLEMRRAIEVLKGN